jgi:hypothetical protein
MVSLKVMDKQWKIPDQRLESCPLPLLLPEMVQSLPCKDAANDFFDRDFLNVDVAYL